MRILRILPLLLLAACAESEPPWDGSTPAASRDLSRAQPGCYLGHQSGPGDTVLLNLDTGANGTVSGAMQILIDGKDSRKGSFSGTQSAGIIRGSYRFMQEGMTDSIRIQLKVGGGGEPELLMLPAAYDAQTGREYPDSSKEFSIRLRAVPCEGSKKI